MECASLPSSFLPSFLISSIRTPGTITTLLPSGRFPPPRGKIRRCRSLGPRDLLRREKEFGKKRHHPYFFYSTRHSDTRKVRHGPLTLTRLGISPYLPTRYLVQASRHRRSEIVKRWRDTNWRGWLVSRLR